MITSSALKIIILKLVIHISKLQKPEDIEGAHLPLLPVMFFIHGGGFSSGNYFGMGPKDLLEKDIVLVEIQYRLGPLGFMCLDHEEIAGNMGMLDQVQVWNLVLAFKTMNQNSDRFQALALEWVKDHIAGFGGNPNEVTIFGESAGAASVSYHLLSPLSRSLQNFSTCLIALYDLDFLIKIF